MTLTVDFQGKMLKKKTYHRNRGACWHEKKGIWIVALNFVLSHDIDIVKVKFWKSCISGIGESIYM